MNCWHCERPAVGACVFCGRATCKDHVKFMPNVISVYRNQGGKLNALVVPEAMYCGVCKPKEDPVDISDIEK